jgi:hypothetical protein
MSTAMRAPSRPVVAYIAIAAIAALITFDTAATGAVDLFNAPPPFAYGSGQAPTGAHCTAG